MNNFENFLLTNYIFFTKITRRQNIESKFYYAVQILVVSVIIIFMVKTSDHKNIQLYWTFDSFQYLYHL